MKENFDKVMDYIDENIKSDTKTIVEGISKLIGYNGNYFKYFFILLTKNELNKYILNRRLYFAAIELCNNKKISVGEIAIKYGYSENSSFTKAFKKKYKIPPNEFRKKLRSIDNDKYSYSDFNKNISNTRSGAIFRKFKENSIISDVDMKFLENIHSGYEECEKIFDIQTCYAIGDLSDNICVPFDKLLEICFDLYIESHDQNAKSIYAKELDISLGILEKICEHYECNYYEVDDNMVCDYYESKSD